MYVLPEMRLNLIFSCWSRSIYMNHCLSLVACGPILFLVELSIKAMMSYPLCVYDMDVNVYVRAGAGGKLMVGEVKSN